MGVVFPTICYLWLDRIAQARDPNMRVAIGPWFLLGLAFEITAFVLGIIAWPDRFAKATVITISLIIVLALLFVR